MVANMDITAPVVRLIARHTGGMDPADLVLVTRITVIITNLPVTWTLPST